MLTRLPSGETILLTLWELTIIAAALVFAVIVFMKIARSLFRFSRKFFSSHRRSRPRNRTETTETMSELVNEGMSE